MNPPEIILLDELPSPKQDDVVEVIRYLRTSLNAHKIYPIGHKMIVQSVDRLLKQIQRMAGGTPHFVVSLLEDALEFNGEKLKRRGNENQYVKEMAGIFKEQRLQTLVFQKQTKPRDISNVFALLASHDPEEDGALDLPAMQAKYPSILINTTVVRRTVGDKVRDHMPDRFISSAELAAVEEEPAGAFDPDEVIANLPPEVRSGRFFYELLTELPSHDEWPSSHGGSLQIGEAHSGPTPLQSSGEFSSLSMPGITAPTDDTPEPGSLYSQGNVGDVGGELMLDLEDEPPRSASVPALPGMPPIGDLASLPPDLQARFQQELTRQLDQMVPTMFNQYLQQLTKDPAQGELRQSILAQLSPEKIEASQHELVDQMERAQVRDEMNGAITLYKEMLDQQFEKGILLGVSKALEELEARSESSSSTGIQDGTARVIEHLQQPDKIDQLIAHGIDLKRADARQLLSQLAPSSLPQCIKALAQASDRDERRRLAELLIELSRNATPEKREAGFASLLEHLKDFAHGDKEREFLLELLRSYSPFQFESYIIQNLSSASTLDERSLLIRHAIAHDSPKLRGLLTRLLENRALVQEPEEEELLLQYLHRRQVIDVIKILDAEIENHRQNLGLRSSAIWLLGAVETPKAIEILKRVLQRRSDLDRPYYPEALRLQALQTLARLPRENTEDLIRTARKDDALLIQALAAMILNEPLTISTIHEADLISEAPTLGGEEIPELKQLTAAHKGHDTAAETTIPNDAYSDLDNSPDSKHDTDLMHALPEDWIPPAFWTKSRLIIVVSLGVIALLTIGWLIGRLSS